MNINKLERKLRKAMLESTKKNIGKKKVAINSKLWMSEEIKEAIKNRNELRKEIGHKREEWIAACKNTSELIVERKKAGGKNRSRHYGNHKLHPNLEDHQKYKWETPTQLR